MDRQQKEQNQEYECEEKMKKKQKKMMMKQMKTIKSAIQLMLRDKPKMPAPLQLMKGGNNYHPKEENSLPAVEPGPVIGSVTVFVTVFVIGSPPQPSPAPPPASAVRATPSSPCSASR